MTLDGKKAKLPKKQAIQLITNTRKLRSDKGEQLSDRDRRAAAKQLSVVVPASNTQSKPTNLDTVALRKEVAKIDNGEVTSDDDATDSEDSSSENNNKDDSSNDNNNNDDSSVVSQRIGNLVQSLSWVCVSYAQLQ